MECYSQRKVELPSGADLQRERGRDEESVLNDLLWGYKGNLDRTITHNSCV